MEDMHREIIGGLKVIATLIVFFCHCGIVCHDSFGFFPQYLDTPAWGGVFMFFSISGFLAYNGFGTKRYTLNREGIISYYRQRFKKVLLPTWIFISLAFIFNMGTSEVTLFDVVLFLTCTFNGSIGGGGILGVGATWYVFIVMWLYLLTPFFYWSLTRLEKHFKNKLHGDVLILFIIVLLGLSYRIAGKYCKIDWYPWLYANVLGGIDLYLIGFIGGRIAMLNKNLIPVRVGNISALFLLLLIFLCSSHNIISCYIQEFYQYVSPTFWSLTTILIILGFINDEDKSTSTVKKVLGKLNKFAPFSFAFYLWHSMLLRYVADKMCFIANIHLHVVSTLILGFVVTVYVSYFWNMIVDNIKHIK